MASSSGTAAAVAATCTWQREDFFEMTSSEIHRVKLGLAGRMGVHYCSVGADKPMGLSAQGITGMTATDLKILHTELTIMLGDTTTNATAM